MRNKRLEALSSTAKDIPTVARDSLPHARVSHSKQEGKAEFLTVKSKRDDDPFKLVEKHPLAE
jgi:hypothetical protein